MRSLSVAVTLVLGTLFLLGAPAGAAASDAPLSPRQSGGWSAQQTFPGVVQGATRLSAQWQGPTTRALPGVLSIAIDYTPPDLGLRRDRNYVVGGVWRLEVVQGGVSVGEIHGTVATSGVDIGHFTWDATGAQTVRGLIPLVVTGSTGAYRFSTGTGKIEQIIMNKDGTILSANYGISLAP